MHEIIKESLDRFIKDKRLRVLVIKGPWGVGKTYYWKNYWRQSIGNKSKSYAYVSLFGLEALEDVRNAIVTKAEFGNENWSKEDVFNRCKKFVGKYAEHFSIPYLGSGALVSKIIQERAIKDYIICFDDFERRGKNLEMSTLLGLVSELKEEKGCKVVLIFNHEKFDPDAKAKFEEFREKVVDSEIEYDPSVLENMKVAWPDSEVPEYIADVFERLGQNNIRVMKQVRVAIDYFSKSIRGYSDSLRSSFNRNVAILTIFHLSYYTKEQIEQIASTSMGMLFYSSDDTKKQKLQEEFKWVNLAGYCQQDFDIMILEFLTRGYVNFSIHERTLANGERLEFESSIKQKYHEIWNSLHDGFVTQQEEFVDSLKSFIKENNSTLSLPDLCSAIRILADFEEDNSEIISLTRKRAEAIAQDIEYFDYSDWAWRGVPEEFIQIISEKFTAKEKSSFGIAEAIKSLTSPGGWNSEELRRLTRFSEEDYYQWLLSERNLDTPYCFREFRSRFSSDDTHGGAEIWSRMESALQRIRGRSKADEFRVSGILKERTS